MKKEHIIKLIKIAFWLGALTDALAAKIMIFPQLRVYLFGADNFEVTSAYRYALGLGASLMLGWTVLLIWGTLKPIERRGLLIITIFPVIFGILLSQLFAVQTSYISLTKIIPVWIYLFLLSIYFLYVYYLSNRLDK